MTLKWLYVLQVKTVGTAPGFNLFIFFPLSGNVFKTIWVEVITIIYNVMFGSYIILDSPF